MIIPPLLSPKFIKEKAGIYFCLLLMLPSLIWAWLDKRVWPWDQADYGYYSIWLWKILITSPWEWGQAMMLTLRLKTPGLPWLAQFVTPLGDLTGYHDSIFLTFIILTGLGSLLLIWLTALKIFSRKSFLVFLCPLIMAAAPLFVAMNQQFLVEIPQMMAVCWLLYIITHLDDWPVRRIFWHTTAAFLWGCLMKVTFPLYGMIAVIWITVRLFVRLKKNPSQWNAGKLRVVDYAAMVFSVLGGLTGLLWLTKNLPLLWLFVQINASHESGAVYGSDASFFSKVGKWLFSVVENYFTLPAFLVFLLIVLLFVASRWKVIWAKCMDKTTRKESLRNLPGLSLWLVCTASLLLAVIVHASQANEVSRFLIPLLPFFIFFLAGVLFFINNRFFIISIFAVFGFQYLSIHSYALGLLPDSIPVTAYLWKLDRDTTRYKQISGTIEETAARPECARRWIMAGCSVPTLNRSTLSYFMMKNKTVRDQNTRIFSYNYGDTDLPKLVQEIKSKRPVYIITLPASLIPTDLPEGLNLISPSLEASLSQSPWYQSQKNPADPDILIYKIRNEYYLPMRNLHE